MDRFFVLLKRDISNCVNKRMFIILGFLVIFQLWLIIGSGSASQIEEGGEMNYMAIVFSFNFLGSLAALALTFDSISKERQSKVMDMILTSGPGKRMVVFSKIVMNLAVSVMFSAMYIVLMAIVYLVLSGNTRVMLMCVPYFPALVAFNFIFCMLGLMLSIFFRSSKTSFIVSMVIGLLCMPRLLISVLEGIAQVFHLSKGFVDTTSMISPAMILNALSGAAGGDIMAGIGFLAVYCALTVILSVRVFCRQDELNYGE